MENKKEQKVYLSFTVFIVLILVCFRLWPYWLQTAVWNGIVYTVIAYFTTIHLRIALWIVFFHFGVNFWLFPSYFTSFKDPRKMLWPVVSFEKRANFFHIGSLIFRAMSAGFIGYLIFQFFQDEKILKDLKVLGGGISDLLDYGEDFILGHQLGDGNKNKTESESTFSEKIQAEMKKSIEDE
jgi:hypothetical protein